MWAALTTLLPGEAQGSSGYAHHHSRVKDAREDTASYLYRGVIGFFLACFFLHIFCLMLRLYYSQGKKVAIIFES